MQIKVTCATRGAASVGEHSPDIAARGTDSAARQEALAKAVAKAATTRKAVYLEF
jgi:hypothetical protein